MKITRTYSRISSSRLTMHIPTPRYLTKYSCQRGDATTQRERNVQCWLLLFECDVEINSTHSYVSTTTLYSIIQQWLTGKTTLNYRPTIGEYIAQMYPKSRRADSIDTFRPMTTNYGGKIRSCWLDTCFVWMDFLAWISIIVQHNEENFRNCFIYLRKWS